MSAKKTNVLVLAAGYGVRLYPLTLNRPKPLLDVAGRPAMDWVLEAFDYLPNRGRVCAVTNSCFAGLFREWAEGKDVALIENGSMSPEDKLGAIGDLALSLRAADLYGENLLILGGDTLFTKPQRQFVTESVGCEAAIGTYDVGCLDEVKRFASVELGEDGRLTGMVEKPENPTTTLAGSMVYYLSAETVPMVDQYLGEGNPPDPAGKFMQWLHTRVPTFGFPLEGVYYDIGCHRSLDEASAAFGGSVVGE